PRSERRARHLRGLLADSLCGSLAHGHRRRQPPGAHRSDQPRRRTLVLSAAADRRRSCGVALVASACRRPFAALIRAWLLEPRPEVRSYPAAATVENSGSKAAPA